MFPRRDAHYLSTADTSTNRERTSLEACPPASPSWGEVWLGARKESKMNKNTNDYANALTALITKAKDRAAAAPQVQGKTIKASGMALGLARVKSPKLAAAEAAALEKLDKARVELGATVQVEIREARAAGQLAVANYFEAKANALKG